MDALMTALLDARSHADNARDGAYVAYWVARDGRDLHIEHLLVHAALLAEKVERIRALRPDLAEAADQGLRRFKASAAQREVEKGRAHG